MLNGVKHPARCAKTLRCPFASAQGKAQNDNCWLIDELEQCLQSI